MKFFFYTLQNLYFVCFTTPAGLHDKVELRELQLAVHVGGSKSMSI